MSIGCAHKGRGNKAYPVSHARRNLSQTFNTSQALSKRKVLAVHQELLGLVYPSRDPKADHASKRNTRGSLLVRKSRDELLRMGSKLGYSQIVPVVRRQTGIGHALNSRFGTSDRLQVRSDLQCIASMGLHAQVQCLGTAVCEPAVVGAGYSAGRVLEESRALCERCCARVDRSGGDDECAHDNIGVTVDIFRETVDDGICS